MHKLYIRVIKDKRLKWMYFCGVPDEVYEKFNAVARLGLLDLNAYLSMWARDDFLNNVQMDRVEHIDQLKRMIVTSCKNTYAELYAFEKYGLAIDKDFWIRMWTSSHMKTETERLKILGGVS